MNPESKTLWLRDGVRYARQDYINLCLILPLEPRLRWYVYCVLLWSWSRSLTRNFSELYQIGTVQIEHARINTTYLSRFKVAGMFAIAIIQLLSKGYQPFHTYTPYSLASCLEVNAWSKSALHEQYPSIVPPLSHHHSTHE